MKCKCGNQIDIQMGAKINQKGCKILTSITTIVTAQCEKCGIVFQAPINTNNSISRQ